MLWLLRWCWDPGEVLGLGVLCKLSHRPWWSGVNCPGQGTEWTEGVHLLGVGSSPGDRAGSLAQSGADTVSHGPAAGQQSCGAEESSCSRGSCLALGRFCDGTDDCGDGSDEDAEQCREHLQPWGRGKQLG